MSKTSGRARSSHHHTFSRRAFNELTFQVAIRTPETLADERDLRSDGARPRRNGLHPAAAVSDHRLGGGRTTVGTARTGKIETVGSVVARAAVAAVEARARLERAIRTADHLRALLGRTA